MLVRFIPYQYQHRKISMINRVKWEKPQMGSSIETVDQHASLSNAEGFIRE
jgi:hypothetical protein